MLIPDASDAKHHVTQALSLLHPFDMHRSGGVASLSLLKHFVRRRGLLQIASCAQRRLPHYP
eukprot:8717449-Karenia_brevis.AAC.1